MSKLRIHEKVTHLETGKVGIIKNCEVIHEGKNTIVKYLVDFGGGIQNWKIATRKEIKRVNKKKNNGHIYTSCLKYKDGQELYMVGKVEKVDYLPLFTDDIPSLKGIKLRVGFSIYNGKDEYNETIAYKIAMHRLKTCPFATMYSTFTGEFNEQTVMAILQAKAQYIMDNWNNFYRPKSE